MSTVLCIQMHCKCIAFSHLLKHRTKSRSVVATQFGRTSTLRRSYIYPVTNKQTNKINFMVLVIMSSLSPPSTIQHPSPNTRSEKKKNSEFFIFCLSKIYVPCLLLSFTFLLIKPFFSFLFYLPRSIDSIT